MDGLIKVGVYALYQCGILPEFDLVFIIDLFTSD